MTNEVRRKGLSLPSLIRAFDPLKLRRLLPDPSRMFSTGSICPVCINLGNEAWDAKYREKQGTKGVVYGWHTIYDTQILSADEKECSGCQIIAWALEPYMALLEVEDARLRIHIRTPFRTNGGFIIKSKNDERFHTLESLTLVLKVSPYELREESSALSESSLAASEKVQTWYSECFSTHKQCLEISSPLLPTRVIRIEGPGKAKLHVPGFEHAEYACLSHCWGGQSVIQTTTRNFEQYTTNLPWEDLPKTFQDAIQFSYTLGFSYLWIDSLCIIQDSIADWRHEGSQMSQIYTNASITLSATWAANPRQGCFVTTKAQYMSRTKTFMDNDHETYEIRCHEELPELEAPLHERGWVFQERMLSRRIVHFMEQELWWECRESFICECEGPQHRTDVFGVDMKQAARLSEFHSVQDTQNQWDRIVETYMTKSLTYPSDIFPALQGLAKLVPSSMGQYLAGHWMKTLLHSLCWFVAKPARTQLEEWRAPSWSWAAAQETVRWFRLGPDDRVTTYVTVLSATTTPKGDDIMGQISYGAIVLRGKYLVGQVQEAHTSFEDALFDPMLEGSQLFLSPRSFLCYPNWDCVNQEDGMQVIALKISEVTRVDPDGKETILQQFWLILSAIQGVEGEYVRVGMMEESGSTISGSRLRDLDGLYEEEAVEMDFKIV